MTLFEQFHSHIGGLIRLKTQLFWYNSSSWDRVEERVCLLMDVASDYDRVLLPDATVALGSKPRSAIDVLLFMDGSPKWAFLTKEDVEFI